MQQQLREVIIKLGYDPDDVHFSGTPDRVERLLNEYKKPTEEEILAYFEKKFPTQYDGLLIKSNIKVKSLCPHHLKDIEYIISIGVIFNGWALGLSKYTRFAKRLAKQIIIQEDLTMEFVKYLYKGLNPKGVAVVIKGIHGCEKFRGIEQESPTITSQLIGPFYNDQKCREEFFLHLKNKLIPD